MRHPISDDDRRKVATALANLGDVIRTEYPEAPPHGAHPELDFRWGQGVGFSLALDGVVAAALPGWKSR
jgi:hypothetical protein